MGVVIDAIYRVIDYMRGDTRRDAPPIGKPTTSKSRARSISNFPAAYNEVVKDLRSRHMKLTYKTVATELALRHPEVGGLNEKTVRTWVKKDGLPQLNELDSD